jgi:5-formaminoimidazole-4-carboxamide-1-beta-D-ribofuranosyl 5'-monophosphate synthetase
METRVKQKISKPRDIGILVKYGGTTYVALCYAKMKRGYFTAKNYKDFQLNREKYCKDIGRRLEHLWENNLLEKRVVSGVSHYRITLDGEHGLRCLADRNKKRVDKLNHEYAMKGYLTKQANQSEDPLG